MTKHDPTYQPKDRSIRFFVSAHNILVPNAKLYLSDKFIGSTNNNGEFIQLIGEDENHFVLRVECDGYETYTRIFDFVGTNGQQFIQLIEEKKFKPTKQWIIDNFRTNISYTANEGDQHWLFTGNYPSWSEADFQFWLSYAKQQNLTVLPFNIVMDYKNGPFPKYDLSNDLESLQRLIDKCYDNGIVPSICLQLVDEYNRGTETVKRLRDVIRQLDFQVAMLTWEWDVYPPNRTDSQFTPMEAQEVMSIFKEEKPDGILCVEFAQPNDREELIFSDRRTSMEPTDWLKSSPYDIFLMELPQDLVTNFNKMVMSVGEIISRFEGPFTPPSKFPDGSSVPDDYFKNFSVDWGIRKRCNLFEYGSFQKRSNMWKTDFRLKMQSMVPIKGFGEG